MKRVTGLGGVFFRCQDNQQIKDWYHKHLGIDSGDHGKIFRWRELDAPEQRGATVWMPLPKDTDQFPPGQHLMINYRVDNLEALLAALKDEGVEIVGDIQHDPFGKFASIVDPEGQKIALWEPIADEQAP
jgi:lactoylglutathione lyase